jgi:hypothetical protein
MSDSVCTITHQPLEWYNSIQLACGHVYHYKVFAGDTLFKCTQGTCLKTSGCVVEIDIDASLNNLHVELFSWDFEDSKSVKKRGQSMCFYCKRPVFGNHGYKRVERLNPVSKIVETTQRRVCK